MGIKPPHDNACARQPCRYRSIWDTVLFITESILVGIQEHAHPDATPLGLDYFPHHIILGKVEHGDVHGIVALRGFQLNKQGTLDLFLSEHLDRHRAVFRWIDRESCGDRRVGKTQHGEFALEQVIDRST